MDIVWKLEKKLVLERLLARPTATLSLEAQQRREKRQKQFGDI